MFEHTRVHHGERHRRRDDRHDMGRRFREELRRNFRHRGGGPDFFFENFFGPGRRGPAVRRGEVRSQILAALLERPMHGYEIIQELESQSGGRWRPSAGSIYPTLQQLSDEGLVTGQDVEGRRVYTITDEGRKVAADSADRSPWTSGDERDEGERGDRGPDIRELAMQLAAAVIQVQRMGSSQARRETNRILADARKQIYRLLSDDDDASTEDERDDAQPA